MFHCLQHIEQLCYSFTSLSSAMPSSSSSSFSSPSSSLSSSCGSRAAAHARNVFVANDCFSFLQAPQKWTVCSYQVGINTSIPEGGLIEALHILWVGLYCIFSGHDFELGNNALKLSIREKIVFDRKVTCSCVCTTDLIYWLFYPTSMNCLNNEKYMLFKGTVSWDRFQKFWQKVT